MDAATRGTAGRPQTPNSVSAKYGVPESSIYSYENMDQIKNNPAIDAGEYGVPLA